MRTLRDQDPGMEDGQAAALVVLMHGDREVSTRIWRLIGVRPLPLLPDVCQPAFRLWSEAPLTVRQQKTMPVYVRAGEHSRFAENLHQRWQTRLSGRPCAGVLLAILDAKPVDICA